MRVAERQLAGTHRLLIAIQHVLLGEEPYAVHQTHLPVGLLWTERSNILAVIHKRPTEVALLTHGTDSFVFLVLSPLGYRQQ